jgi:signal transduction histidine kinase
VLLGLVLLGGVSRSHRLVRRALDERARNLAQAHEEDMQRQVADERLRIARDLHDSVTHSLVSIAVQAGVGAHLLDADPHQAEAALLAIKQTSGEALGDLRATLDMLRSDSGDTGARDAQPRLSNLGRLVESSRAAGLPVEVVMECDPLTLPKAVDVAAYRIVQESLTNVIRHAGPARAIVTLRNGRSALDVEVVDNGAGRSGPLDSGGHGLANMRERVMLLGGSFNAGPVGGTGFQVHAVLPIRPPRAVR